MASGRLGFPDPSAVWACTVGLALTEPMVTDPTVQALCVAKCQSLADSDTLNTLHVLLAGSSPQSNSRVTRSVLDLRSNFVDFRYYYELYSNISKTTKLID